MINKYHNTVCSPQRNGEKPRIRFRQVQPIREPRSRSRWIHRVVVKDIGHDGVGSLDERPCAREAQDGAVADKPYSRRMERVPAEDPHAADVQRDDQTVGYA